MVKITFYAISRLNSWLNFLHILKNTIIINIMEQKINTIFKNMCEFSTLHACGGMPLRAGVTFVFIF